MGPRRIDIRFGFFIVIYFSSTSRKSNRQPEPSPPRLRKVKGYALTFPRQFFIGLNLHQKCLKSRKSKKL